MEQRAQRVLCKKLGFSTEGPNAVQHALQEYLGMYQGVLPQEIISALVVLLKLDDDDILKRDEALIELGGGEAPSFLEEVQT